MKRKMTARCLACIAIVIACSWGTLKAAAQISTNGLTLSAEAQLLLETNDTRVFLTVHLLNSSDHEIVVLTRGLNAGFVATGKQMSFTFGFGNPSITHEGHKIVPSLYDFSPVTLQPNEEAFFSKEMGGVKQVAPDSHFVVRYEITSEWGKRFTVWCGSVQSKPIRARLRKPQ